jgi:hypothetical protein
MSNLFKINFHKVESSKNLFNITIDIMPYSLVVQYS